VTEILTVADLAAMLKMSKGQVYEMTSTRTRSGNMREHPLPVLRINGNVRFRKADVEDWLEKLVARGKNL
jgi:excisionase family DNA binding protein